MDKSRRISFLIAGAISLIFLVFHVLMFRLFNWKETLIALDRGNWAIFQTFNLVTILMVAMITYFSFRHPVELAGTPLGKSTLLVFSLFYFIRILAQFLFFGFEGPASLVIVVLCLVPALIYLWISIRRLPAKGQAAL